MNSAELSIVIKAVNQAEATLRQVRGQLSDLDGQHRRTQQSAGGLSGALDKLGLSGKGVSSQLAAMAVSTMGVGAAVGGATAAISYAIGTAAQFQQSLQNVKAATGASADEMKLMRGEALKIGADTSKSASEAVAAMGELTRAGVSVKDVVGGVARTTVQLAEATGASVSSMATLLSNALNTFQLGAGEADRVANVLAKAANASSIEIGDLGQSLSAVGPVAVAAGLTIEDLGAAIGIMGNNALRGSDAGTSLKAFLAGLTPNSKEAAGAMRELGFTAFDAQGNFLPFRDIIANLQTAFANLTPEQRAMKAELIFGSDAVRAFNVFMKEGVQGLDQFKQEMAGAPSVAEMSRERLNSLNGQVEQLKGSLETLAIEVGTKTIPVLTELVSATSAVVNQLGKDSGDMNFLERAFDTSRLKIAGADLETIGGGIRNTFDFIGAASDTLSEKLGAQSNAYAIASQTYKQGIEGTNEALSDSHRATDMAATSAAAYAAQQANAAASAHTFTGATDNAIPRIATLGEMFGKTKEQIEKGVDWLAEFDKRLTDLTNHATPTSQAFDLMSTKLQAATSSAEAMVATKVPEHMREWKARATEMIDAANLTPEATRKLKGLLDAASQGGPAGAKGMESFKKAVDEIEEPLKTAAQADRDLLKARAETEKAFQTFPQTVGELGKAMRQLADDFAVNMGRVPTSAKEAMSLTEKAVTIDLSKPGADVAIGYANSYGREIVRVVDASGNVIKEVKGKLSTADYRPEGIAAMQGYAAAIRSGDVLAIQAAGAVMAAALRGLQPDSAAAQAAGANLAIAFALGIESQHLIVDQKARFIGKVGADGLLAGIQAQSPSVLGIRAGMWLGQGFAIGITNEAGEVIAAAHGVAEGAVAEIQGMVTRLNYLWQTGAIDSAAWDGQMAVIARRMRELNGETEPLADALGELNVATAEAAPALASLLTPARQAEVGLLHLQWQIKELQKLLAHAEPESATAKELERLIQLYQGMETRITSTTAVLRAQQALWEAQRTVLDGVNQGMAEYTRTANNAALFGGGAPVVGLGGLADQALGPEGDFAKGQAASAGFGQYLESLRSFYKDRFPQIAAEGWRLWGEVFNATSLEAQQAALARLREWTAANQAEMDAAARGSAATFWAAFAEADASRALGSFSGTFESLRKLVDENTAANSAAAGRSVSEMMAKFRELPEYLQAQLGPQMHAAIEAYAANPTEEGLRAIEPLLAEASRAYELLPKNLAKLPPEMQRVWEQLRRQVEDHEITLDQAKETWAQWVDFFPKDFAKLPAQTQAVWHQLREQVENHAITIEQAKERFELYTQTMPKKLGEMLPQYRAAIDSLNHAWLSGLIGPEAYQRAMEQLLQENADMVKAWKDMVIDDIKRVQDEWRKTQESMKNGPPGTPHPGPGQGTPDWMKQELINDIGRDVRFWLDKQVGGAGQSGMAGAAVPALAGGGHITGDGFAYLHAGERVQSAEVVRGGGAAIDYDRLAAALARALGGRDTGGGPVYVNYDWRQIERQQRDHEQSRRVHRAATGA